MGKGKLLVPSDVTLLEERYTIGKRRIRFFERLGLLGTISHVYIFCLTN